ncbi:hypothetical protein ACHAW5_005425 [Stephanodiscus triporus]|uniref:Proteasome endopeptidase complex n=1 Tax=Stephanodiscus triporus TaxID=2934178 RepID=A0ABD3NVA6_9STRA
MSFFDVGRRFAVDRWQSPLEGLAPLPSSSLESRSLPRTSSHPPFDCDSMSHVAIGPGPSHPHEIDVVEELLRRRSSRQQQHSSRSSRTMPRTRRTGTTIVALLAENSTVLILAADTRSTDGSTVADNRCEKLHQISRNVWCAGAGTSADVDVCVIGRGGVFYRRAVAREEELTWKTKLDGWNDSDDAPDCGTLGGAGDGADGGIPRMSSSRKNDAGGGNDIGVNGFGNVPFAIQSKRVVCGGGSDHHAKRERDRWLDEVMYAE